MWKRIVSDILRTRPGAILTGLLILVASGRSGAQDSPGLEEIVARVNKYQEGAFQFVRSIKVVQTVVQESSKETRKEKALVLFQPPSQVNREVQWSNIGHPSNGFPLKHLMGFRLLQQDYTVSLVGVDEVGDQKTYKLRIQPTAEKGRGVDGFLWVSARDYGPVKVAGSMTNPPFPIKSIKMEWAYLPGPSGLWVLQRDSTDALAKIVFKTIKGTSVATYSDYEMEGEGSGVGGGQ